MLNYENGNMSKYSEFTFIPYKMVNQGKGMDCNEMLLNLMCLSMPVPQMEI